MTQGGVGSRQAGQTLEGSFSAVSTPIFASKYAFFSIFRDVQDSYTFAPLRHSKFADFCNFWKKAPRGAAPQGAAPLKGLLGQHVKAKAFFTCASPRARGSGWLHCRTIRCRKFFKFEKGECVNTLPWIPSSFLVLACFPSDEILSFNNVWQRAVGFVV